MPSEGSAMLLSETSTRHSREYDLARVEPFEVASKQMLCWCQPILTDVIREHFDNTQRDDPHLCYVKTKRCTETWYRAFSEREIPYGVIVKSDYAVAFDIIVHIHRIIRHGG